MWISETSGLIFFTILVETKSHFPATYSEFSKVPEIPFPPKDLKFSMFCATRFFSSAFFTIAFAKGCSLLISKFNAICKSWFSVRLEERTKSVTTGVPFVIVPVLSKTTVLIFPAVSKLWAVLNKIPFFAPFPFPTIIATGVANPKAQGQLITKTLIPRAKAKSTVCPTKIQITKVIIAITITDGTKIPLTLSAIFAIGAFEEDASLTSWIILLIVVSFPTFVALHFKNPLWFKVPLLTLQPISFSTGRLSPVKADSSIVEEPSITIPSTGINSPGFTTKISSIFTFSTATETSFWFWMIVAVCGESFINDFNASVVFPFEIDSKSFPTEINTKIIAADSKYKSWVEILCPPKDLPKIIKISKKRLQKKEIPEPRHTKVSIFGEKWTNPLNPVIKNFLLIIKIINEKTNWTKPIATGELIILGSGSPNICPMLKYIKTNKNPAE